MVEFIKGMLYTCECGYKTTNAHLACRHSKTIKCQSHIMDKKDVEFVLKDDYTALALKSQPGSVNLTDSTLTGNVHVDNTVVNDHSVVNVNITLSIPNNSVVGAVYDVFNNPDFISDIRAADPQQTPAILFKYTRGISAEQACVKYDSDKDIVRHMDPVTGKETAKDLKRYRNEYLKESANLFDDVYHIPYAPTNIQRALKDMTSPAYDTGKKKEKPISGAQVIKMCASGDHRMYKFPLETKEFYNDVAKNVDVEIKST